MFRYVALGDSTAVGVGAQSGGGYPERLWQRMRATGAHVGLLNLGVSGATSADVLRGQTAKAAAARAQLITVGVGNNDLWRGVSPEQLGATLRQIVEAVHGPATRVVVSNVIDLSSAPIAQQALSFLPISPAMIRARVDAFNEQVSRVAALPGVQVFDLHAALQEQLSPEYFSSDGFHPSGAGYARWAELLWPLVEPTLAAWRSETG
jgi:acyl-CoA thioesterase I